MMRSALVVEQARELALEPLAMRPPLVEGFEEQLHEPAQGHVPPAEAGHEMHQWLEPVVVAIGRIHNREFWLAAGWGCTDQLEDREAVDRAEQAPRDHLSGEGAPAVRSDRGTDGLHARLCHRRLAGHERAPPGDGVPAGYSSFRRADADLA